jgi:hypothetical protein
VIAALATSLLVAIAAAISSLVVGSRPLPAPEAVAVVEEHEIHDALEGE